MMERKSLMKCLIFGLIASSVCYDAAAIKVEGGAYQNIVIEIQKDVPHNNCLDLLNSLQNNLQAASERLHSLLNERIYYGSFDIILPTDEWFDSACIGNSTFKHHNGAKSDIILTDTHQIFGDNIRTLQNQCDEEGDHIFASYKNLLMHQADYNDDEFPQRFTGEWLKYRYGVFDEDGSEGDEIFPQCSGSSSATKSNSSSTGNSLLCQDALEIQSLMSERSSSHNRFLPSKQNFKCHEKSALDVILSSSNGDFSSSSHDEYQQYPPVQIHKTKFNFVKKALTRYVVIIEDHYDLSVRDSFQFLKDALRKWIESDLDQTHTEVAVVMMRENQTNAMIDGEIKAIASPNNRDYLFSQLPWYIENAKMQSPNKCLLQSYLEKSFKSLQAKSGMNSAAENVMIVIAPGMYDCNDGESNRIISDIEDAGMKLITINYPQIGSGRVELDRLSDSIESYTIFEEKQNEQQSLLNTFLELSNALMSISQAHSMSADTMPVEIYRKQIVGDKNQIDSFNFDEATDDIQFFVYIYDRREKNIEKNFKLTSPTNKPFESLTEQRAEYHQLGVLGKLSEVGSWNYNLKRFFSPQPTFVQVLARPKAGQEFIRANAYIRKIDDQGNFVVYCKVYKGNVPVNDAVVEMTISLADHFVMRRQGERFLLLDNGSEPDVTKNDGIYTKFLHLKEKGVYKLDIVASSNGDIAYTQSSDNEDVECCGSSINTQGRKRTVSPFQRYVSPLFVYHDATKAKNDQQQHDSNIDEIYARISDLKISHIANDSKLILEFTEPDVKGAFDSYYSTLFFEIFYTTNLIDIHDNPEIACNRIEQNATLKSSGERKSLVFDLKEYTMVGRKVFIAVGIRDKSRHSESLVSLSNIVGVLVKKPSTSSGSGLNDSRDKPDSLDVTYSADTIDIFSSKANVILIAGLVFLIVVFALAICLCCILRRKYRSKKKTDVASSSKQNISINVVSQPSMYEKVNQSYTTTEHPKQFFNSTMYEDEHENMNNLSYNIYDQQYPRNENGSVHHQIFDDGSVLNTNENALNQYDCWTASQLLNVHEKNSFMHSEVDKESDSIYNTKYPPISLSRHELYAAGDVPNGLPYIASNNIGLPPPIYSSLGRNFPSDEYSQYVDKNRKIRNVTIV